MGRTQTRFVAWMLAAIATGVGAAHADDDANRKRYARETLIAEATSVVSASGEETNLEPLVDALENDRKLAASWRAAGGADRADVRTSLQHLESLVANRAALLPSPDAPGGLAVSRRLYRWVLGLEPCPLAVRNRDGGAPRSYPILPPAPAPVAGPPEPGRPTPPAPDDAKPDPWAPLVRSVLEAEVSLLTKLLESSPTPCLDLTPLATVAAPGGRGRLLYEGPSAGPEVNEPWLRLRAVQAKERVEAYAKEVPTPGLVDESTVREKVRRATERREEAEAFERAREAQLARLDALVDEVKAVRKEVGDLAGRIDEGKRVAGASDTPTPTAPEASPPLSVPELAVRELEAQEALASLHLRLLFWAALRANARTRLLDDAAQFARTEVLAAELSATRFTDELQRVRRERQLDRLDYEAVELAASLEEARRPPGPETPPRPDQAAWSRATADVYAALLTLNGVVRDAVRLRRQTARSDAPTGDRPAPPAATATAATASARDDLVIYRDPEVAGLDVAYVKGARTQLARFDAALVTRNHAAAVRRISALRVRLRATADRADVAARFDAAAREAEARIEAAAAVAPARARWRLSGFRRSLEQARADHADAVAGIDAEKARLTTQLAALTQFRDTLLDQGHRSFGIRVDPEVNTDEFAADAETAGTRVEDAWRWITFRGDEHVGTFARRHALALGALTVLTLLAVLGVRGLRRAITARLDRVVLDPTASVAGASVEEERDAIEEKKAQETAAMKAAEAAALSEVSGAPAPPKEPPPPAATGPGA